MDDLLWKNIVLDEKLQKDIVIDYLRYKISYGTNSLFVTFHEMNGCIKDYGGSKYLILISAMGKYIDIFKKYKGMRNKIINRETWNNSSEYFGDK